MLVITMKITRTRLKQLIIEELTKKDVKDIVSTEVAKQLTSIKNKHII